jgi:DNA-binding SARP family transcriptional activator/TolB-like protein
MIRLRTFGGVDLRDEGDREIRRLLAQPKRVALLIYLALTGESGFRRRDKVVALFWPNLDDEHARGSLRQALTFLRRTLGERVITSRGEDEIGVDRSMLECDALDVATTESDEVVIAAYKGDFLDGFHVADVAPELQSWIEDERVRFRRRAAKAAWELAVRYRAASNTREAATFARRAAQLSPDDETETRRLIGWLDEIGDRAGAIAVYEEFASRLEREFEARPSPETQALIGRVRARNHRLDETPWPDKTPSVSLPSSPLSPLAESIRAPGPSRTTSRAFVTGSTVIAVVLAVIFLVTRGSDGPSSVGHPTATHSLTIAVLPLRMLGPDTSRQYIADGLTDALITSLAQDSAMRVINSKTMLAYRDSALTADDIARRLNAQVMVSGNVQYVGDTVHLTLQLTRPGEAAAIFARGFSGNPAELLRMQRDVARTLVRQISGSRIDAPEGELTPIRHVNREAGEQYMLGRYYWSKRGEGNLHRSIGLFTQALDADPQFALAYSGMADAYVQLGYASLLEPSDAFLKAEKAAKNALDLDSTLAEPHATLGFVNLYYHWNWDAAESEFQRAIRMNPSYATAHEWYGLYLTAMGRFDDALRNERRAQELDPLSAPVTGTAAWVQYYAGRVTDARSEIGVALRMDSAYALGRLYLSRILQEQGHLDSAMTQYAATGPLRSWIPTIAGEGYIQAQLGQRREAEKTLARMDSIARSRYVTAYAVALVYAALGSRDKAFEFLRQGQLERTHWMVWLNRDPRWAPLRRDPRFAEIIRAVGLPP